MHALATGRSPRNPCDFFLTIFAPYKWFIKKIDKLRRNFLWNADEEAHGGKCLVNWKRICAPKAVGGLGIKNLSAFSTALRLRWPWFEWDDMDRPWKGTLTPCDAVDQQLFQSCTKITVGNGARTTFWTDRWLDGVAPMELAPGLYNIARHKMISVADAIREGG